MQTRLDFLCLDNLHLVRLLDCIKYTCYEIFYSSTHYFKIIALSGYVRIQSADTELISSCSRFIASELRFVLRGKE